LRPCVAVRGAVVGGALAVPRLGLSAGLVDWLVEHVVPNEGADSIAVTQDPEPRLVMAARTGGTLAVYDARSGAWLRYLDDVGLAPGALQAPWWRAAASVPPWALCCAG